ncbi:MAG: cyanophycinase [Pirellulaceae bacterium]
MIFVCALAGAGTLVAAETASPVQLAPDGIRGALFLGGGGDLPSGVLDEFVRRGGGKQARLVVIPTAGGDEGVRDVERILAGWRRHDLASVEVLHTRDREEADRDSFVAPLRQATAVWFSGGQQSRLAEAFGGTLVERELLALLNRDGVIGGTSAGAAIQSRRMIAGGNPLPQISQGFDLLPDGVVDQHFSERKREARLQAAIADGPPAFGLGIDEGTAVVVEGRRLRVLGRGKAWVYLPPSPRRPLSVTGLAAGEETDLTALRRAVRVRRQDDWPPRQPAPPRVAQGTLFIAGGGRLTPHMLASFVEAAGGPDALIVILPTASEQLQPDGAAERRLLEKAGARNLVVLPGRRTEDVESTSSLAALERAGGVWFGGGRQWRFVDAYASTRAWDAFRGVLQRGGAIGGSSAGASIQADYLVRGSPLGNTIMMAEGYERGFGFLPGVAIDQHFTQRRRQNDLRSVVQAHPQFLGIGIDESTALIVRGSVAEVVGEHSVWVFAAEGNEGPVVTEVPAGQRYDLVQRSPIRQLERKTAAD